MGTECKGTEKWEHFRYEPLGRNMELNVMNTIMNEDIRERERERENNIKLMSM